ncbi:MAG: hypothetical protein K0U82_17805, partial [Planctomycetes bacterium]|nr:hypothetical protein [Planctomycetota bacterium]
MHLQRQLITAILMLMVCFSQHTFAAEVEEPISAKTPEQIAALGLRGFYTNLQHNKDGSVRLVRLSKPHVTLDKLEHLEQFLKLDYLAIVCPHLGDEGLVHIQHLTNLDTLMLSES